MTFEQGGRLGVNSNDTATETVYEYNVLKESAVVDGFQYIDRATTARFRLIPEVKDGEIMIPLDPNGQPEEYQKKGNTKDTFYNYRHMIGTFVLRCDIMNAYKDRRVTVMCTETRPSDGDKPIRGASPATVILNKVKWKAREQWYRNKQGVPFDTTVPKHWISWVGLNPSKSEIAQCTQQDKPDMRSFPFPSTNFLVQTIFWEKDGEPLSGKAGVPTEKVIYKLPKSAWALFEKNICTRKFDDKPLDPSNCHFTDFITPEGGQVLTINKATETSYVVSIDFNAGIVPLKPDYIQATWKQWGDVINVMTYQESIMALGKALGEETVGYGLLGSAFEDFCPQEWLDMGKQINDSMRKEEIEALAREHSGVAPIQTPVIGQAPVTQFQAAPVGSLPNQPVAPVAGLPPQAPTAGGQQQAAPTAGLPAAAPAAGLPTLVPAAGQASTPPPPVGVDPTQLPPPTANAVPAPVAPTTAPPVMQSATVMQQASDTEIATNADQDAGTMQASLVAFQQNQEQQNPQ